MSTESTDNPQALAPQADVVVLPGTFRFDVAPGVLFVSAGRTYWIRNLTRFRVRVSFPDGAVASASEFTLEPKGQSNDRKSFTTTAYGDGDYEYTVDVAFNDADSIRATGGSNPRIVYN